MNDDLRREMVGLLTRIVGDKPLPPDLQRTALELFARLAMFELAASVPGRAATNAAAAATLGASTALPAATVATPAAVGNRRLIYVHGICRHDKGFSNDWWSALQSFVTVFGLGQLGVTRLEVIWSDLVNQSSAAFATGMMMGGAGSAAAPDQDARARMAAAIRETLRDRADQQQMAIASLQGAAQAGGVMPASAAPTAPAPAVADIQMVTGGSGIGIPGMSCIDDFSIYLVHEPTRQAVIDRFIAVVRPEFQAGRELDIITHSWGTVVAYEGLRQMEAAGIAPNLVRNFFTVGSALSIGAVKLGLRSANKDGKKPASVRRWINLDAAGDLVGGPLKGRPYAVDEDFVNLEPFGCGHFLTLVNPACAHSSYFQTGNIAVNQNIFGRFINS
jgi:metacaspase-1